MFFFFRLSIPMSLTYANSFPGNTDLIRCVRSLRLEDPPAQNTPPWVPTRIEILITSKRLLTSPVVMRMITPSPNQMAQLRILPSWVHIRTEIQTASKWSETQYYCCIWWCVLLQTLWVIFGCVRHYTQYITCLFE